MLNILQIDFISFFNNTEIKLIYLIVKELI